MQSAQYQLSKLFTFLMTFLAQTNTQNKMKKIKQKMTVFFSNMEFNWTFVFGSRKYLNLSTGLGLSVYIIWRMKQSNN